MVLGLVGLVLPVLQGWLLLGLGGLVLTRDIPIFAKMTPDNGAIRTGTAQRLTRAWDLVECPR
jgi:hypothetical protein